MRFLKVLAPVVALSAILLASLLQYSPIRPIVIDDGTTELPELRPDVSLDSVRRALQDRVIGAESFAFDKSTNIVVSGLADGRVVAFDGNAFRKGGDTDRVQLDSLVEYPLLSAMSERCEFWKQLTAPVSLDIVDQFELCGRPLGMHFVDDGLLVYADVGRRAIMQVNVRERLDEIRAAIDAKSDSPSEELPAPTILTDKCGGTKLLVPNSVAFKPTDATSGSIFFTESSQRFPLAELSFEVLDGRYSGRLCALEYTLEAGALKLASDVIEIADGIGFANGLVVTDDSHVIVASTTARKMLKYDVSGLAFDANKKLNAKVLSDNLPGQPDNVRWCVDAGTNAVPTICKAEHPTILVALGSKYARPFALMHWLKKWPMARQLLSLLPPKLVLASLPKSAIVAVIDSVTGELVHTLYAPMHSNSEGVCWLSEAFVVHDTMLLGSFLTPFMGTFGL
ncbi:MAG: hypothetical protein MHM6MM_002585 [Cercozoa sp. M6MM]